jgi:hypothetical protein
VTQLAWAWQLHWAWRQLLQKLSVCSTMGFVKRLFKPSVELILGHLVLSISENASVSWAQVEFQIQ